MYQILKDFLLYIYMSFNWTKVFQIEQKTNICLIAMKYQAPSAGYNESNLLVSWFVSMYRPCTSQDSAFSKWTDLCHFSSFDKEFWDFIWRLPQVSHMQLILLIFEKSLVNVYFDCGAPFLLWIWWNWKGFVTEAT